MCKSPKNVFQSVEKYSKNVYFVKPPKRGLKRGLAKGLKEGIIFS